MDGIGRGFSSTARLIVAIGHRTPSSCARICGTERHGPLVAVCARCRADQRGRLVHGARQPPPPLALRGAKVFLCTSSVAHYGPPQALAVDPPTAAGQVLGTAFALTWLNPTSTWTARIMLLELHGQPAPRHGAGRVRGGHASLTSAAFHHPGLGRTLAGAAVCHAPRPGASWMPGIALLMLGLAALVAATSGLEAMPCSDGQIFLHDRAPSSRACASQRCFRCAVALQPVSMHTLRWMLTEPRMVFCIWWWPGPRTRRYTAAGYPWSPGSAERPANPACPSAMSPEGGA